jgi:hypothetical protein|tara:strand:- start:3319 stop:3564 length:246 start_codon:yes stop_codon:yes gene_type:complete
VADQVGPTENNAGATSGNTFNPEIGEFVTDLFGIIPGLVNPPPAAQGDTSNTENTIVEAPNYIPIAIAAVVGAVAIAWALK